MLATSCWASGLCAVVPGWFGESLVGWVGDLIVTAGTAIRSAIFSAATYLQEWAIDFVVVPIVEGSPAGVSEGWAAVRPWMDAANSWAPITEWILMLGAYLSVWTLFVLAKLVFKAIPTVG